jgi:hypothetical protein
MNPITQKEETKSGHQAQRTPEETAPSHPLHTIREDPSLVLVDLIVQIAMEKKKRSKKNSPCWM